ncbi:ABC transporter ATP-binding protein [Brevibacillus sp. NRS-1366]|uniref:ABC transporter ATP-binding protein n=1 Tax=Brevibacillus sp. NRS-1366 TaxID=3233899 RepID=UPI003D1BCC00
MTAASLLRFEHVSKSYGETQIVKDLSIEIKDGEFVAILGPSGCGKTTSLRMIAGLEPCNGGQIIYQGEVIDSPERGVFVPPDKRGMGMVFQSYAIWPHMTVYENVAYPLKLRRMPKDKIKLEVENILAIVGLKEMADRQATQLSGGQQQRVALARSLVFHPKILLLDEPFSNLDAKLREQMRIEVKLLQKRLGITVIFVTHDQVEALSLADRIIMMSKGNVEQEGTPQEIYERPRTPFVRDFMGKTIMLEAKIADVHQNGQISVVKDGKNPVTLTTFNHYFPLPRLGERCLIAVRSEQIRVVPLELAEAESGHEQELRFCGSIETLLFIGDQYEALITLDDGEQLHLFIPKTHHWQEGQAIILRFNREVSVWPE